MTLSDVSMTIRFHRAVQEGDVEAVKGFLSSGVDGNEPDLENDGKIALLEATRLTNVQLVQTLLNGGCSPNSRDSHNQTALHTAVKSRAPNAALVNVLLAAGADPALTDSISGMSPMHLLMLQATGCRSPVERAMFVKVLHAILPGSDINGATYDGNTALHLAAKGPTTALVRILLDAKADVNCQNSKGETPLMISIANNQVNIAKMILDICNCDLSVRDRYKQTALHYAANFNSIVVESLLLYKNYDVNAIDVNGATALHLAAAKGHGVIIKLLLKCSYIMPHIKNMSGKSAVDIVEENCFGHLKQLFVTKHEDVILRHSERLDMNNGLVLQGYA